MNLVYDFQRNIFVVSPACIVSSSSANAMLAEHIARHFQVLPLRESDGRLMLLTATPADHDALSDLEIITGLKSVPLQLDINGGRIPTWKQIDAPPPADTKAWEPSDYPEASLAIKNLIELIYLSDAFAPVPPVQQDTAPAIRLVDLLLTTAIKDGIQQLWVLPRPKQLVVLAKTDAGWSELMTPSKFVQGELLMRLKRLARIQLNASGPQKALLQAHNHTFELETHQGEYGEEALIRLLRSPN